MKLVIIVILAVLITLAACRPPIVYEKELSKHDYVIARVDTLFEITMPQFYDMLAASDLVARGGILDRNTAGQFLDSILCDTLAGLAAADVPLDQYYNQWRLFKLRYHNAIIRSLLNEVVYKKVSFDSTEVVEFYHSRPDLFSINEQVNLYHILISPVGAKAGPDSLFYRSLSPEQLDIELGKHARYVRSLIDSGRTFTELAAEYSHDKFSNQQGGYIGWTERGVYRHPFDSVAFSLGDGEVSQPYKDPDGYHIIYIEKHMPEGIPPYDSVAYMVASRDLYNTKANALGAQFFDSVHSLPMETIYNEAILDTNVYLVEPSMWAAIINKTDTLDFNDLRTLEETFRSNNRLSNTTVELKKEMIAELAKKVVLVQVARDMKIDTLPDVVAAEKHFRHVYSKEIVQSDRTDLAWQPEEQAVRDYYDTHIDDFTVEKPLEIQQIVAGDSSFAEFLRDQAMSGVDFLQLAQEYYPGEEAIRKDLANLGFVGPGEIPDEIYEAALITPVGEVSRPVKTEFGYHIVKVVTRNDMIDLSHARLEIVPILKKQHAREVFEAYRDKLYDRFNVSFPNKLKPIHLKPLEYRSSKP